MKHALFIHFIITLFVLTSCVEKVGYYEGGQKSVIEKLTNKEWHRDHHAVLDNGEEFDVHEIWRFSDKGNGSYKSITTYEDGDTAEKTTYFHWSFTTPDFSIIYMDYPRYWSIERLDDSRLCVYQTYDDPLTVLDQERQYKEYTSE